MMETRETVDAGERIGELVRGERAQRALADALNRRLMEIERDFADLQMQSKATKQQLKILRRELRAVQDWLQERGLQSHRLNAVVTKLTTWEVSKMAKEMPEKEREWMVPVRWQIDGTVFVKARTDEEAAKKALAGEWDDKDPGECYDWEIRGRITLIE